MPNAFKRGESWVMRVEPPREPATDQDRCQLDRQIDQLVYELYDLTDDEIAIVEAEVGE